MGEHSKTMAAPEMPMRPLGRIGTPRLARRIWIYLLLVALLVPLRSALAQAVVGEIVSVLGTAEVLREGRRQAAEVGATLAAGDAIRTGVDGRLALQLVNGSQLKLNANSRLELKQIAPSEGLAPASTGVAQSILRLIGGEAWVRGNGETLEMQAVPATATIRGTEFDLAVGPGDTARLAVLDGLVEFHNPQGSVRVAANEQATAKVGEAPRKTVLLNPLDAVQWSLYYPDLTGGRAERERSARADPRSPRHWTEAARGHLLRGQVPEARRALDRALALSPNDARAYSLRAVIELVQNRKAAARADAERAVAADPASPEAYLALSRVQQAEFDLDGALASARRAVELDPDDPHALIQESGLLFGMGRLNEATDVAERARQRAPNDAMVNTVWGFLELARYRVDEAGTAFEAAIAHDSTLGLPHLGLGLTLFRRNQSDTAVAEMRKATLLDPKVSLYNSYLGKAYYETKDDRLAQTYLEAAKQLDPRDPTPHFYDAIRKQSVNRPVEAVQDLQTSAELNDNRAVYRSQLLLDEDLAARSAALGKIYNELGFGQLGLREGGQSLAGDPANHSAHRLLADSYLLSSKHEIARVSELLQSQLLQPINVSPVQPRLAEANLYSLGGFGPSTASLYEYNPLFVRDRPTLSAAGIAGNNNTLSDEVIVSGIADRFSYSLGQAHYQTDGFRDNADLRYDLYNVFAQAAVTPQLDLQIEYRRREMKHGSLRIDPQRFDENERREYRLDTGRLGAHYSISPASDVLLSLIYTDAEDDFSLKNIPSFNSHFDVPGRQAEAQYLFRADRFNLVAGGGISDTDLDITVFIDKIAVDSRSAADRMVTGYLYGNLNWPRDIIWTMGLGYGSYELSGIELASDFLPKLGVRWNFSDDFSLRAAYLQTVKRSLATNQTIEPTQVAGFNQFYDDANGTKVSLYGVGLDGKLSGPIRVGVEALRRDLDIPVIAFPDNSLVHDEWREHIYRAYLYWMIDRRWAASAEFELEKFEQTTNATGNPNPERLETITAPLAVQYFDPSGFFAKVGATYVKQDVEGPFVKTNGDEFAVVDAAIGYRLPNRWGLLSLEVRNLLDQSFYLVDDSFRNSSDFTGLQANARFMPDRTILAGIRLNF